MAMVKWVAVQNVNPHSHVDAHSHGAVHKAMLDLCHRWASKVDTTRCMFFRDMSHSGNTLECALEQPNCNFDVHVTHIAGTAKCDSTRLRWSALPYWPSPFVQMWVTRGEVWHACPVRLSYICLIDSHVQNEGGSAEKVKPQLKHRDGQSDETGEKGQESERGLRRGKNDGEPKDWARKRSTNKADWLVYV
mmetsp:Transcript_44536/g.79841  ORF Transcript_44536/g.79841 Transcript_44536/m.79841 type:complete len:191 (+) Transcript_44536:2629-3201(+)